MCGIMGYVGTEIDAGGMVFAGLRELEYRGYDSWGVAVQDKIGFRLVKEVGKLPVTAPEFAPTPLAIGHTRWATTGVVSRENAHPHVNAAGTLAVVHNGIIENHGDLRNEALAHRALISQTDSELIVHYVDAAIGKGSTLAQAVVEAANRFEGLNAFVVARTDTNEMAAVKTGSPLHVGRGATGYFIASDAQALLPVTDGTFRVQDGQLVLLSKDACRLIDLRTGRDLPVEFTRTPVIGGAVTTNGLGDFPHYTEKEISEQPAVLRKLATDTSLHVNLAEAASMLARARRIIMTGCGTAHHSGMIGAFLMHEIGLIAEAVYSHELAQRAETLSKNDLIIALSQSGETIDTLEALRVAHSRGCKVLAITNVPTSTLAAEADLTLFLEAGPEKSVLSTKAFTAKVALLMLLVQRQGGANAVEPIELGAAAIERMLAPHNREAIRELAGALAPSPRIFLLGAGAMYPLALEGALKIKEVSYIHAEAFAAGELKHGVLALIERKTPCIALVDSGSQSNRVLVAAEEVRAREGFVIGLCPKDHDCFDFQIPIPHPRSEGGRFGYFFGALAALQLLSYELALKRGCDPDKPRNLAKSVTVR